MIFFPHIGKDLVFCNIEFVIQIPVGNRLYSVNHRSAVEKAVQESALICIVPVIPPYSCDSEALLLFEQSPFFRFSNRDITFVGKVDQKRNHIHGIRITLVYVTRFQTVDAIRRIEFHGLHNHVILSVLKPDNDGKDQENDRKRETDDIHGTVLKARSDEVPFRQLTAYRKRLSGAEHPVQLTEGLPAFHRELNINSIYGSGISIGESHFRGVKILRHLDGKCDAAQGRLPFLPDEIEIQLIAVI